MRFHHETWLWGRLGDPYVLICSGDLEKVSERKPIVFDQTCWEGALVTKLAGTHHYGLCEEDDAMTHLRYVVGGPAQVWPRYDVQI